MKNNSAVLSGNSLIKSTLIFSLPLVATGILQLLFNAADMVVVGNFAGPTYLAAVGATSALINLIISVFQGLSVGVSVSVAQGYGAGDKKAVHETVHTAIPISIIAGIALTVIGFFGTRFFLTLMDTPADVIDLSTTYMQIYFLGVVATMVFNFGAAVLRASGDTKNPLIFLVIAGVVNVLLNLLLVIVFDLHVAGVAIATVASQIISAVLVIIHLMRTDDLIKLEVSKMRIYKDKLFKILKIGVPSGLQSFIFSLSNVIIQSSVNSFGSEVMAGNTAAANIEGFIWMAMNSFHQSALTFTGQYVGAGRYDKIKKVLYTNLAMVTIVGLSMGLVAYALRYFLLGIYLPGEELQIEYGIARMAVITVTYFTCGLMDVMTGAMRGLGSSLTPMIITVLGVCGIRIGWVLLIFPMFGTQFSLYISYPLSWIVSFFVQLVAYFIVFRSVRAKYEKSLPITV